MMVAVSVMSWVVAPQWHHSPRPVGAQADDLLHHAEDRIADALGLLLEAAEVDVLDPAFCTISRAAFSGMMPSRAWARASAARSRGSSRCASRRKDPRISAVLKMSRKIAESSAVAGICLAFRVGWRVANSE